jgi:hypothetical protein
LGVAAPTALFEPVGAAVDVVGAGAVVVVEVVEDERHPTRRRSPAPISFLTGVLRVWLR